MKKSVAIWAFFFFVSCNPAVIVIVTDDPNDDSISKIENTTDSEIDLSSHSERMKRDPTYKRNYNACVNAFIEAESFPLQMSRICGEYAANGATEKDGL